MKKPDSKPQEQVEKKTSLITTASLYKEGFDAQMLGQSKKAESCFEQVIIADSKHTPSLIRLGMVQKEMREESKAIRNFVIASGHPTQKYKIKIGNDKQDAVLCGFFEAANLYVEKSAYSDAIDILETGLEIFSLDNNLLNTYAWANFYKGNYLNAVGVFDKILQSSQIASEFFLTIRSAKALSLLLANKLPEAKKIYNQWCKDFDSLGSTPNIKNWNAFNYAQLGLGLYYLQSKNTQLAEKYFENALTANESLKPHLLLIQGIGLSALGHYQSALKCFQAILDLDQRSSPALFHSGMTHIKLDEQLKAKENFEKALQIWPDNQDIVQALGSLPASLPDKELKYSCSVYNCMSSDTYLNLMKTVADKLAPQFESLLDKAQNKSQRVILQNDCISAAEREFNKALINELANDYRVLEKRFDHFVDTQSPSSLSTVFFLKAENALLFTLNRQLQRKLKLVQYHLPQINPERVKQMQEIYLKELTPLKESFMKFKVNLSKTYYEPADKYFLRINQEQDNQYETLKTAVLKLQADPEMRTLLKFNHDQEQGVKDIKKEEQSELKNGIKLLNNLKPALIAKQEQYQSMQNQMQHLHNEYSHYKMIYREQQNVYQTYTHQLTANLADLLAECNQKNDSKAPETTDPIIKNLNSSFTMIEQLKLIIQEQRKQIDQLQKVKQERTSAQKLSSSKYIVYADKQFPPQRKPTNPIPIVAIELSSATKFRKSPITHFQ